MMSDSSKVHFNNMYIIMTREYTYIFICIFICFIITFLIYLSVGKCKKEQEKVHEEECCIICYENRNVTYYCNCRNQICMPCMMVCFNKYKGNKYKEKKN